LTRKLFTVASAVSLLLCATTCVLWVGSYWMAEEAIWGTGTHPAGSGSEVYNVFATSQAGRFDVMYLHAFADWGTIGNVPPPGFSREAWPVTARSRNFTDWGTRNGFRAQRETSRAGGNGYHSVLRVVFPCWLVVLLTCLLPGCWLLERTREATRRQSGLCTACGYDLRASPGRCPECGAVSRIKSDTRAGAASDPSSQFSG
jgi:hypothetical protein